jgi:hypothetical protein
MKKISLFFLCFSCLVISCEKNDDAQDFNTPVAVGNAPLSDFNTLIVGKWKLTELGTPKVAGCNDMKTHPDTDWDKTNNAEVLEFKNTGDFSKDLKNDGFCKGNYKISNGNLVTQSDCSVSDIRQPINDLTANTLILETHSFGLEVKRYKYTKF